MTHNNDSYTNITNKDIIFSVFEHILTNERTTIDKITDTLQITKEEAKSSLNELLLKKLIKVRNHAKIHATYYYPNNKMMFCVYVFLRPRSFVFIASPSLDTEFIVDYLYTEDFYPDINLHLFLKKSSRAVLRTIGYIPGEITYLVMDGQQNENNRWQSNMYPEFLLTSDLSAYAAERARTDKCTLISHKTDLNNVAYKSKQHIKDIVLEIVKSNL